MTVQPRSRRSPSDSGCATPGSSCVHSVASGPATCVPLSEPRSTSDTSRPDRWSAAWAEDSTFCVSAIGTGRALPAVTSSWLSGRRPRTRSSSTVTTRPSSKRSTGADDVSGRQNAVCSPEAGCSSGRLRAEDPKPALAPALALAAEPKDDEPPVDAGTADDDDDGADTAS